METQEELTPRYVFMEEFRPKPIYVFGAGGFSKEVAWLIRETGNHVAGFIDEDDEFDFHEMLDGSNRLFFAVMGVGYPKIIARIVKNFSRHRNLEWPTIIHSSVIGDFDNITFEMGCVVCAGNVLTTDIHIGKFNVLNLNSTLGHDLNTGAFCVINPNCSTSANVTLEGENLVGVGATILANRTLYKGAVLGAGALLTKDIPPGEVWAGVPARKLGS